MKLIGDGGWRELSPKRYELWQFVEVDGARKQKTKRVKCGKRELGEALRAFQSELADQLPPSDSFAAYAASWCAWRRECGRYAESTCRQYECRVDVICGYIGDVPMADVTPEDCRKCLMAIKGDRNLSGTSTAQYYAIMHCLFESAVNDDAIPRNPCAKIEKPGIDTEERNALSPDELDGLWRRIEELPLDGNAMAAFLALDAGLRIGECVWLESKDVGASTLFVTRSKTVAGKGRAVPMTTRLAAKCAEWRDVRNGRGIGDAPTFCCRMDGTPLSRESVRQWYKRRRTALGAPAGFHDLRHANLSKMARFMSAHDLQRWAGWARIDMAMRYVHDDFSQLEAAVKRAEDVG